MDAQAFDAQIAGEQSGFGEWRGAAGID